MKRNVGRTDRMIRIGVGAVLLLGALLLLQGWLQLLAGVAGLALLATGTIGYCGLYSLLGISTCPIPSKK